MHCNGWEDNHHYWGTQLALVTRSDHQRRSAQICWDCALIHFTPCELLPLNTEWRSSEFVPFYRVCSDLADSGWHHTSRFQLTSHCDWTFVTPLFCLPPRLIQRWCDMYVHYTSHTDLTGQQVTWFDETILLELDLWGWILDFHFSFYSRFSRFLEKNSISLLDLWDFLIHSLSLFNFQDI